jgi:hypothetical protein
MKQDTSIISILHLQQNNSRTAQTLLTLKTNCLILYYTDRSKSIPHSPTVSLIQFTREDTNTEYLLKVNTQHTEINLTQVPNLLLDLPLALESLSLLHQRSVTS